MLEKELNTKKVTVEHVGSTAVPGLMAKPIIDIDVVVENNEKELKKTIDGLANLGYVHVGNLGIEGREVMKRNIQKDKSDCLPNHNLYVCKKGASALNNHLGLRDYLRKNYEDKIAYGLLKQKLAKQFPYDIDAYVEGKTNFIVEVLKKIGFEKKNLTQIIKENKK